MSDFISNCVGLCARTMRFRRLDLVPDILLTVLLLDYCCLDTFTDIVHIDFYGHFSSIGLPMDYCGVLVKHLANFKRVNVFKK